MCNYSKIDVEYFGFSITFYQQRNIRNSINTGMVISMHLVSISKATFLWAAMELVNNIKKYILKVIYI